MVVICAAVEYLLKIMQMFFFCVCVVLIYFLLFQMNETNYN